MINGWLGDYLSHYRLFVFKIQYLVSILELQVPTEIPSILIGGRRSTFLKLPSKSLIVRFAEASEGPITSSCRFQAGHGRINTNA